MDTVEQIKSLRKHASQLNEKNNDLKYKIHWACNELDRIRAGNFNNKELLALFSKLVLQINQNSEDISLLKEGVRTPHFLKYMD